MTTIAKGVPRLETGVRNLDALLRGGLPRGSTIVVSGPPGSGKTILAQQICFHNAGPGHRVLYFNTLSEPTAKTLKYLAQLGYFDPAKLEESFEFVDLGDVLRLDGLARATELVMEHVKRVKPAIVVIDSFRVFDAMARSSEELRKFVYELTVQIMAWECTTLLLGEYAASDYETNPLFSITDGFITLEQRLSSGEQQRFLRVVKMRGTSHFRDAFPFTIADHGIDVFAPRVTINRDASADARDGSSARCQTGVGRVDELLGEGIPRGSSLLVAGVAGTGKTVLLLEFIYEGAVRFGEKGIIFSFEESGSRLCAAARGLGWNLEREIERGMVELVFIPQPEIQIEQHLLMMRERVEAFGARRVAIDSVSVFLHKLTDPQAAREKVFQLASIVQNSQAVGLFATDIPYGSHQISRFGVEETVVDGIILLSSTEQGLSRDRYVEIYKLRNTAHLQGRHSMRIAAGGITVFPRYQLEHLIEAPSIPAEPDRRVPSGIAGLDELLGGGLVERSVTLVSGSAGIGKTTLGIQFLVEGAKRGEFGLYAALEEGPAQIETVATRLGLSEAGRKLIEVFSFDREDIRSAQVIAILAEKIQRTGARRFVLDSASRIQREAVTPESLLELLHGLVVRLRSLGVTSVLTLEADSLFSIDSVTDRRLSPVSDNLITLRYAPVDGRLERALTVVKTRGSDHAPETNGFTIGPRGLMLAPRPGSPAPHGGSDGSAA